MESLSAQGYLIIPCKQDDKLEKRRNTFLRECRNFKEYQNVEDSFQFVAGGFSALGNPSSFHNPFVRKMRDIAYKTHCKLFEGCGLNGHALFDRMMLRPIGKSPTAESWHRDITPNLSSEDTMFGGWINFNTESQYFSCVPGSHNDPKDNAIGFSLIKSQAQLTRCALEKTVVDVPGGHMIIFYQNLIHEVRAHKSLNNQFRIFTPFRLTPSSEPLFKECYEDAIENQGVPLIPSGQMPMIWPVANWNYPLQRTGLESFSLHFKDVACEMDKRLKNDPTAPPKRIVCREMRSLRALGLPMYSAYSQEERDIFVPKAL
jgi:hypothetical protein